MHKLVVASLQERGVNCAERLKASGSKSSRKCHSVLLCNTHIEGAFWTEAFLKDPNASSSRHGCSDRDDFFIPLTLTHQLICKDFGQGRLFWLLRLIWAFWNIELWLDRVQFVTCLLRRLVAIAFLGLDVQEDGLLQEAIFVVLPDVLQDLHQGVHVVAINGTNIVEAQLLEELSATSRAAPSEWYCLHKVASVLIQFCGCS
mmetsp:Transcript_20090/g.44288  ORF Transcript_20090/g.44288 Transcript_20090/m.44288 type:complete len:202 (+) Transcript_20090:848-1453(+)